jgi:5-methylcytosine-specific restriction endonuclease McrA
MELRVPSVNEVAMMSPVELQTHAQDLDVLRRQVEAASALLVQRVDAASAFAEDGHRNVAAWGRATNHWSHGEAAGMAKLAKAFGLLPQFAEAAQSGVLGVAQMHAVAKLAANPRVREHLDADADRVLTEGARDLPFDDFVTLLRHFEALADADGAQDRHDRAALDRRASVTFVDERAFLDAAGPAFDGVLFDEVLQHYTELEWQTEWDQLAHIHGDRMCADLMERTPAQRRFDALQRIFTLAAKGGDGKGPAVTVDILIDQATYEQQLALLLGGIADPLPVTHATSRRCEDRHGHLVDPRAAVAASLVGQVRRVVLEADGVVLDMGRRQRLFTGALRDAVMLTARRCGHPGCGVPGHACQADHTIPYARGGPTNARNAGPECGGHNRWKTKGAFTFRDRKGRWRTFRPDGTEIGWPTIVATLGID